MSRSIRAVFGDAWAAFNFMPLADRCVVAGCWTLFGVAVSVIMRALL